MSIRNAQYNPNLSTAEMIGIGLVIGLVVSAIVVSLIFFLVRRRRAWKAKARESKKDELEEVELDGHRGRVVNVNTEYPL